MTLSASRSATRSGGDGAPTSALAVSIATDADDPELRRLLRDTPMPGAVSVAFAREPSFFHGAGVEGETTTVTARSPDGRMVALFSRSARQWWVDGSPRRVGYLSALRVDPVYRHRRALLRIGFDAARALHEADPDALPYALTTIVSDNAPARRLLEAGLPGLPTYHRRDELVTFAAPTWRRRYRPVDGLTVRPAADWDEVTPVLARWGARHAYAVAWDADTLRDPVRCRGLAVGDVAVAERAGRIVGCVARWDQSGFKQTVVHGYQGPLRWARPLANAVAPALGIPRLPAPGAPLKHAYLSHLAVDDDDPEVARALVTWAHDRSLGAGYSYLTTMLAVRHPLYAVLRRALRPLEYRSMLYLAAWATLPPTPTAIPHLEVAVL
ncbi:MAG: hypothetical protein ABMB14_17335 [Myxococcota bacterium]